MKLEIETSNIKDANEFGELLRAYFFTKNKGYGCYENFELEPEFVDANKAKAQIYESIKSLYFPFDDSSEVNIYIHKNDWNIFVAWRWDGDGTLIVSDGERVAVNFDCKKDYKWEWVEETNQINFY